MQNEKTFDAGEVTLNYFEGAANGSPLVLLHGLTANKLQWYPLIPGLTANWHVYAPDFRGHGKSDRAQDNQYRNADYARDVIAFLKFIGEPVALIGHSLGAMVSIVTASRYPAGVKALVLLDPPLFSYTDSVHLQPATAQWFKTVSSVMQGQPTPETIVERLRPFMPEASDEALNGTANWIVGVAPETAETALREELWQGVDLPQALQQIACPTLLIHGDWDHGAAMRGQDVDFFKANCPAAHIVCRPDADHGLKMQERPNVVLKPITEFLRAH